MSADVAGTRTTRPFSTNSNMTRQLYMYTALQGVCSETAWPVAGTGDRRDPRGARKSVG